MNGGGLTGDSSAPLRRLGRGVAGSTGSGAKMDSAAASLADLSAEGRDLRFLVVEVGGLGGVFVGSFL